MVPLLKNSLEGISLRNKWILESSLVSKNSESFKINNLIQNKFAKELFLFGRKVSHLLVNKHRKLLLFFEQQVLKSNPSLNLIQA